MDGWTRDEGEYPAWVNRLATIVLALVLLYVIVGIPGPHLDDGGDPSATDAVDPVHRFAWVGLFLACLPLAAVTWRRSLRLLLASWPVMLLYVLFGASLFWALDPDVATRRYILGTIQLLMAVVLLSGLRRAATFHVLVAGACAFGAVADAASYVLMPGYAMASDGFIGLQLQKNQTGLMMMYGCLACGTAIFLFRGRRWTQAAIAGATLLLAGLLVATRSTTSQSVTFLAPVVMPVVLLVSRLRPMAIWGVVLGTLAAVVGLLTLYLAWCGLNAVGPMDPFRDVTFTMRTDIWHFVIAEIGKRPWLGAGYGSFWAIDPSIQPSLKTDQWFGTYAIINEAHDGYLDLLATNGVVGLVGGLLVVFRTMGIAGRAIVQAEPAARAWQTGRLAHPTAVFHMTLLIGLLVHNFTESNLFSNNSTLCVAFLLTALDLEKWRLAVPARAGRFAAQAITPVRRAHAGTPLTGSRQAS